MATASEIIDKTCDAFSGEINRLFGDELVSIILYGSAVGTDFRPGKSDLNFLVVLTENGIKQVGGAGHYIKAWRKRQISLPLFLTENYIQASLDSFPMEFLNMQLRYRIIQGEDVLTQLKIGKKDLRLQCEREIKRDLLHLRQGFITSLQSKRHMIELVSKSLVAFSALFRALLYLTGKEIPDNKIELLDVACNEFELDRALFSSLEEIAGKKVKMSSEEVRSYLMEYIQTVENLSKFVDSMKVS